MTKPIFTHGLNKQAALLKLGRFSEIDMEQLIQKDFYPD